MVKREGVLIIILIIGDTS